jgi:hypothetical protein
MHGQILPSTAASGSGRKSAGQFARLAVADGASPDYAAATGAWIDTADAED